MKHWCERCGWMLLWCVAACGSASADEQLVFGSFAIANNAQAYAAQLSHQLASPLAVVGVQTVTDSGANAVRHRVTTAAEGPAALATLRARARSLKLQSWTWNAPTQQLARAVMAAPVTGLGLASPLATVEPARVPTRTQVPAKRLPLIQNEFDLGLQSRAYTHAGQDDQSRWQLSVSGQFDWFVESASQRHRLTLSPFFRVDGEDDERTHFDLREGYYSWVGDRIEAHLGARQIFWGVTEFKHLVDVINQTDLVENIDGEDKLGQPLLQVSLSRDWGVLDLFLLMGHRKRTFAGRNGRLRFQYPIDGEDARYESGAGQQRLDGAIRWSGFAGPLSWGLYHFSGSNRDPLLELRERADGQLELVPYYTMIEQTGLDTQFIVGDWSFKLEAISRNGDGDRYTAANFGFERTLVGFMHSRTDLGLVVEYLFDERGDAAHNTLFERDLAVGMRWALNDTAGSEALLGIIWDTQTDEYVVSIEASRQLGQHWQLALEGRVFAGAPELSAQAQTQAYVDGSAKSAFLQNDDFLQLELIRYF